MLGMSLDGYFCAAPCKTSIGAASRSGFELAGAHARLRLSVTYSQLAVFRHFSRSPVTTDKRGEFTAVADRHQLSILFVTVSSTHAFVRAHLANHA